MKRKKLYIDADHALYFIAYSSNATTSLGGSKLNTKVDISNMKIAFKKYINDLQKSFEVLSITEDWKPAKKPVVILSDTRSFRDDIYPEYKANRPHEKTPHFKKLRKWAKKHYRVEPNVEADDVVSYYVTKGHIGATTDKDLLKGVAGVWYDAYNKKWVTTTEAEADRFLLKQVLMGDSTDNIKGIPRVGTATADKVLDKNGATWETVVNCYIEKGLTKEDAILTMRLVNMHQWTPKKGVKLWEE